MNGWVQRSERERKRNAGRNGFDEERETYGNFIPKSFSFFPVSTWEPPYRNRVPVHAAAARGAMNPSEERRA
jgi:hypothetical protein